MAAAWLAFLWSCGASLWSLLDLAKYMTWAPWYNPSSQYPTMPPWDGSASLFPQASDVGSTGCCPLANRISSRAAGSSVSAIGGVALPMALRFMGRRSTRRRWWSCPLRLSLGDVFVLNRAAVPQSLHLMNDLAGTMQPKLLPIGRTPLGKSRGFIHDLNLWFSRSTLMKTREADRLNVSADARPSTKYRCIGCC